VPSNRATTITNNGTPFTQTCDASGNLTNDGVHSYQYDGENRLAEVDAGTSNEADYSYDANNWRVKKTTQNGVYTTYSIWEGRQVIAEYSNAPMGSGTSYYLADRLSNRMITDANGAFKGTQDHLPFGEDANTGSGQSEKHRFTNYERDAESNTDYAMNRQYEMGNGRFAQPDPLGGSAADPQSLNRYGYVVNDPVGSVDPLGLCAIAIALTTNNLLTAAQLTAMKDEINRIYGAAGFQISYVSDNADYWLNVNARGSDYKSMYRNMSDDAVGVTGRNGIQVSSDGRVFVDRLNKSAGTAASYAQNSSNLGIGLGRAGAHEIGHYLLQQAYDSNSIQGVMHGSFIGEQWFSPATQRLWTFNAAQIARIANKVCITPQKAPLNYDPIDRRIIGGLPGGGGGDLGCGGLGCLAWLDKLGWQVVASKPEIAEF
jgi:RHS repeat-associated protein